MPLCKWVHPADYNRMEEIRREEEIIMKPIIGIEGDCWRLTATMESLAATARMSAQETMLGQRLSNSALILSITSNPLRELALATDVFSPLKVAVSSKSNDASHPCHSIIKLVTYKKEKSTYA